MPVDKQDPDYIYRMLLIERILQHAVGGAWPIGQNRNQIQLGSMMESKERRHAEEALKLARWRYRYGVYYSPNMETWVLPHLEISLFIPH